MKFDVAVFDIRGLNLVKSSQTIIDNASFTILKGEYCAVIGPNGGGKTTLFRLILGLEKPSSGQISLFGKSLSKFKEWYKIGFVPQRAIMVDNAFPATVYEVVKMGRVSVKKSFFGESAEDKKAVEHALERMDVVHLKDKLIGELSGGQRQRVMIARALATNPEVLILDEPNTGVDVKSQQRFYQLLRELNQEEKMTILFITHDIGVIADDIDRLFTVNQSLLTCNNPREALSCEEMSKLYGIDAHLIHNHHHHH